MKTSPRKQPHHHGNLRAALIEAGIALLAEGGSDALTLRGCAARAGVSHAAPAHHFDGLGGLKSAIAVEGFRRFRAYMVEAAEGAEPTPVGRLKGICRGYFRFAEEHRALFELIFGTSVSSKPEGEISEVGAAAYIVLRDACAPFVLEGQDAAEVETRVWSLIHGFTVLELGHRFSPDMTAQGRTDRLERALVLLNSIATT